MPATMSTEEARKLKPEDFGWTGAQAADLVMALEGISRAGLSISIIGKAVPIRNIMRVFRPGIVTEAQGLRKEIEGISEMLGCLKAEEVEK